MARAPDGSDMFEVVRFQSPSAGAGELAPTSSTASERPAGKTIGEIVDYENTFLLCYVRGPEGLIVELAERLDGTPG